MTIEMGKDIQQALAAHDEEPVRLIDPINRQAYVLVAAEEYERMTEAADQQNLRQSYPLQEAVAHKDGWDDPIMDEYNDYDAHRQGGA
jgi:hypothetical protein